MKNRKSTFLFCAALSSLALLSCALVNALSREGLTLANQSQSTYCADITFGQSSHDETNLLSGTSSFSTTNIDISEVTDVSKCYVGSGCGEYALKMGSSSKSGIFTLKFSSSLPITSLRVLAYQYKNNSSTLSVYEDSSFKPSNDVNAVDGGSIYDCLSSDWLCYTGFDGNVSSLTFESSARLYLAKVVFVLSDTPAYSSDYSSYSSSSEERSSSSSSSSEVTSPESSSKSSSSNSSSEENEHSYPFDTSEYYTSYSSGAFTNYIDLSPSTDTRVEPVVSEDGRSVDCYAKNSNGRYYVVETIYKGGVYTDSNEVACYINAFGECPANYVLYSNSRYSNFPDGTLSSSKAKEYVYNTYGSKGRLYTYYSQLDGYVTSVPVDSEDNDFHYWEVDIAVTDAYASSTSFNRGGGRLVVFPYGVTTSTYDSGKTFIVKTIDHYQHAREFANYLEGWGANFDMECTHSDYESYSSLTTESLTF